MGNYQEAGVKLTNIQLNKLKSAVKNEKGTVLRKIIFNKKNFEDEELLHELLLTTRKTTKLSNAFANNISTDIKLSKAQISTIIHSGGSFGSWLANFGKKAPTNIAVPLARDNFPGLVSNLTSNAISKFQRKISGKGAFRAEKGFTLFISYEDMNDIIKIMKSLEHLDILIDGVTETVKDETKKQEGRFLWVLFAPLTASLVQPVISPVVKGISGRGVRKEGRGVINETF